MRARERPSQKAAEQGTGEAEDVKGGCNSSPESAGISTIIDVSCNSAWDSRASPHRTGTFPDGQDQAGEISPPRHTDQALPAGTASTHRPQKHEHAQVFLWTEPPRCPKAAGISSTTPPLAAGESGFGCIPTLGPGKRSNPLTHGRVSPDE